jgi:uncharacterized protein
MTTTIDLTDAEARLEMVAAATLPPGDGSHDLTHLRRVRANARAIAADEADAGDPLVLAAACWLHDLVAIEKNDPRRAEASRLSAAVAAGLLRGWGWDEARIIGVVHAIEAHSFSAGIAPETAEARILRDADRLDAIGAIGIGRAFFVAGRLGLALHDADDPAAAHRPPDDRRFAIDHFRTKLLGLGDGMLTATGRRIAAGRITVLRDFLDRFLAEVDGRA